MISNIYQDTDVFIDHNINIEKVVERRKHVKLVYIEANIGAGKSTLLQILTHIPRIKTIQEPVNDWLNITYDIDGTTKNILDLYYSDQKKYGALFQHIALITRMNLLFRTIQNADDNDIIICERSPYSDYNCFAKLNFELGNIDKVSFSCYVNYFHYFTESLHITKPDLTIWMRVSPEEAYTRLQKRKREEGGVALSYLEMLELYHRRWLGYIQETRSTHVDEFDASQNFIEDNSIVINYISSLIVKYFNENIAT